MIAALAELFSEVMNDIRLEGYLAALEDVPTPALQAGLRHAARTCQWFPKPAEVRRAVDAALASQRVLDKAREQVVRDDDWRVAHHCQICADTGWAYVRRGTQAVVPFGQVVGSHADWAVRPCVCRDHNPVIRERCQRVTRYGEEAK